MCAAVLCSSVDKHMPARNIRRKKRPESAQPDVIIINHAAFETIAGVHTELRRSKAMLQVVWYQSTRKLFSSVQILDFAS